MLIETKIDSLADLREARRITQAEVAREAKAHHSDVSRFEAGTLRCSAEWTARLVAAYAATCAVRESEARALLPERYRKSGEEAA